MEQMIMVEPIGLNSGGATTPRYAVSRGTGADNLVTPDPREIWVDSAAAGPVTIDIDLGSVREWDVVALINCNGLGTSTWTISHGVAAYTTSVAQIPVLMRVPSEDQAEPTGPALFIAPAPINSRYIRIVLDRGSGLDPMSAGVVVVGRSFSPSMPREQGAGRPPIDTGVRNRIDGGALAVVDGALVSGFRWNFGDLLPADLAQIWGMFRRLRTTRPLLLVEYPAALVAEGIHWGTFVNLETYERRDQSRSEWSLRIEDWA